MLAWGGVNAIAPTTARTQVALKLDYAGGGASSTRTTGRPSARRARRTTAWRQSDHLFGTFTYRGQPVFGFRATSGGNPLDTFGRNIYVDGTGVTPDIMWQGASPGPYDKTADATANAAITALGDRQCKVNQRLGSLGAWLRPFSETRSSSSRSTRSRTAATASRA